MKTLIKCYGQSWLYENCIGNIDVPFIYYVYYLYVSAKISTIGNDEILQYLNLVIFVPMSISSNIMLKY